MNQERIRPLADEVQERKGVQQDRMKIHFITAAEDILRKEGLQELNLRKVARAAGYSSATLYSYFTDLDELILFGSVRYFKEYGTILANETEKTRSAREKYLKIFDIYCRLTFAEPEIFFNLFYGKHSARLTAILQEYYRLFPDELYRGSEDMNYVMTQGSVYERDLVFVRQLAQEGAIQEENIDRVTSLLGCLQESFLHTLSTHPDYDRAAYHKRFMELADYIIAAG